MTEAAEEDLSEKMSELYVAECNAAKARLEVETECRRIIADNYEKVLEQAKEFSKKLEAPILAKVCEVGYFVDAYVVRTNQVTMEMGASYYMECSLHTADKIIARRVAEMRRTRQDGLDSIKMLDDKIKFAQENFSAVSIEGGPIEIVEKYDDEMEKLFYANRKKRSENKQLENKKEEKATTDDKEHAEMMTRLEELEKLELQNDEVEPEVSEPTVPKPFEIKLDELGKLEEIEEDEDSPEDGISRFGMNERLLAQPGVSQKEMERLLEFLDACDEESSSEEYDEQEKENEEEEGREENEETESERKTFIQQIFNKTKQLDSDDDASDESESEKPFQPWKDKSPKVVEIDENESPLERKRSGVRFAEKLENVKTFLQTDTVEIKEETVVETKSILRNTEPTPVDRSALEPEQKELAAMSSATFPGMIVEKDPYECEPSTSKDPAPVITEKKISKFRASRTKQ